MSLFKDEDLQREVNGLRETVRLDKRTNEGEREFLSSRINYLDGQILKVASRLNMLMDFLGIEEVTPRSRPYLQYKNLGAAKKPQE